MVKHLHFDCFNGISGDMTLGALVDLGVEVGDLEERLSGLPIGQFHLRAEKIKRAGIMGTLVHVEVQEDPHKHSHLKHIVEKVRAAHLSEKTTQRAIRAYELLAEAEARVHGTTVEKVHFHEVGAKDAIVDVAGAMLGVELLGIESFSASAVAVGNGTIQCAHGVMPVPAPATAEILKGLPIAATEIQGELTTPTGAAILRALLEESGSDGKETGGAFKIHAIGYGAGTRQIEGHPNYLRASLGERESLATTLPVDREEILSLETEVDDLSPQVIGYLMEKLLSAGARDVQFQPAQMKKNRPGHHLRVLCHAADQDRLAEMIFRETSTFGLRVAKAERFCLRRRIESVETPLGSIAVKVGLWGDAVLKVSPEFESCRSVAASSGRPLREVMDVARCAIEERYFPHPKNSECQADSN